MSVFQSSLLRCSQGLLLVPLLLIGMAWAQPPEDPHAARVAEIQALVDRDDVLLAVTAFLAEAANDTERTARARALLPALGSRESADVWVRGVLVSLARPGTSLPSTLKLEALRAALVVRAERLGEFRTLAQRFQPRDELLKAAIRSLPGGPAHADARGCVVLPWIASQLVATDQDRLRLVRALIVGLESEPPAPTVALLQAALERVSLQGHVGAEAWRAWFDAFVEAHPEGFAVATLHDASRGRWREATREAIRYLARRGDVDGLLPWLDGTHLNDPALRLLALRSLFQAAGLDEKRRTRLVELLVERLPTFAAGGSLERVALETLPPLAAAATQHHERLNAVLLPVLEELPAEGDARALERALLVVRVLLACGGEATVPPARAAYLRLVGREAAAGVRRELVNGLDRWKAPVSDLVRALDDPDADVRRLAGNALGLRRDASAAPALAAAIERESDMTVLASLIGSLQDLAAFEDAAVLRALTGLAGREGVTADVLAAAASISIAALSGEAEGDANALRDIVLSALAALPEEQRRLALLSRVPRTEVLTEGLRDTLLAWCATRRGAAEATRLVSLLASQTIAPERAIEAARALDGVGPVSGLRPWVEAQRDVVVERSDADPALVAGVEVYVLWLLLAEADSDPAAIAPRIDELLGTELGRTHAMAWRVRARVRGRRASGTPEQVAQAIWDDLREAVERTEADGDLPLDLRLEALDASISARDADAAAALFGGRSDPPAAGAPGARGWFAREARVRALEGDIVRAWAALDQAIAEPGETPDAASLERLGVALGLQDPDPDRMRLAVARAEAIGFSNGQADQLDPRLAARLAAVVEARDRVVALDAAPAEAADAQTAFLAEPLDRAAAARWLLLGLEEKVTGDPGDPAWSARRLKAFRALFPGAEKLPEVPGEEAGIEAHRAAWKAARAFWDARRSERGS